MSLADKVTKGTHDFVSLIVKKILSLLPLGLPLAAAEKKTQWLDHLSFDSTLHLVNGILNYLKKLLKHFNDTAIVAFFSIPLAALSA